MDKIAEIKAEIERLKTDIGTWAEYNEGWRDALERIAAFIKSLPEEPVSEDLQDVAIRHKKMLETAKRPHTEFANVDFIGGALWEKYKIIDKACEWLEENYDSSDYIPNDYGEYYGKDKFIEHLRKALEKED